MKVRNKQCKACPWRVSTDPDRDIPGGYDRELHRGLSETIAEPATLNTSSGGMMACHESNPDGGEYPCVGWLWHQLGRGNNLPLRLLALQGHFDDIEVDGPQHTCFEDTLPDD